MRKPLTPNAAAEMSAHAIADDKGAVVAATSSTGGAGRSSPQAADAASVMMTSVGINLDGVRFMDLVARGHRAIVVVCDLLCGAL
ncbi:MAG: hypothetical protein ABW321_29265 [Polyangiales bacterium]